MQVTVSLSYFVGFLWTSSAVNSCHNHSGSIPAAEPMPGSTVNHHRPRGQLPQSCIHKDQLCVFVPALHAKLLLAVGRVGTCYMQLALEWSDGWCLTLIYCTCLRGIHHIKAMSLQCLALTCRLIVVKLSWLLLHGQHVWFHLTVSILEYSVSCLPLCIQGMKWTCHKRSTNVPPNIQSLFFSLLGQVKVFRALFTFDPRTVRAFCFLIDCFSHIS